MFSKLDHSVLHDKLSRFWNVFLPISDAGGGHEHGGRFDDTYVNKLIDFVDMHFTDCCWGTWTSCSGLDAESLSLNGTVFLLKVLGQVGGKMPSQPKAAIVDIVHSVPAEQRLWQEATVRYGWVIALRYLAVAGDFGDGNHLDAIDILFSLTEDSSVFVRRKSRELIIQCSGQFPNASVCHQNVEQIWLKSMRQCLAVADFPIFSSCDDSDILMFNCELGIEILDARAEVFTKLTEGMNLRDSLEQILIGYSGDTDPSPLAALMAAMLINEERISNYSSIREVVDKINGKRMSFHLLGCLLLRHVDLKGYSWIWETFLAGLMESLQCLESAQNVSYILKSKLQQMLTALRYASQVVAEQEKALQLIPFISKIWMKTNAVIMWKVRSCTLPVLKAALHNSEVMLETSSKFMKFCSDLCVHILRVMCQKEETISQPNILICFQYLRWLALLGSVAKCGSDHFRAIPETCERILKSELWPEIMCQLQQLLKPSFDWETVDSTCEFIGELILAMTPDDVDRFPATKEALLAISDVNWSLLESPVPEIQAPAISLFRKLFERLPILWVQTLQRKYENKMSFLHQLLCGFSERNTEIQLQCEIVHFLFVLLNLNESDIETADLASCLKPCFISVCYRSDWAVKTALVPCLARLVDRFLGQKDVSANRLEDAVTLIAVLEDFGVWECLEELSKSDSDFSLVADQIEKLQFCLKAHVNGESTVSDLVCKVSALLAARCEASRQGVSPALTTNISGTQHDLPSGLLKHGTEDSLTCSSPVVESVTVDSRPDADAAKQHGDAGRLISRLQVLLEIDVQQRMVDSDRDSNMYSADPTLLLDDVYLAMTGVAIEVDCY